MHCSRTALSLFAKVIYLAFDSLHHGFVCRHHRQLCKCVHICVLCVSWILLEKLMLLLHIETIASRFEDEPDVLLQCVVKQKQPKFGLLRQSGKFDMKREKKYHLLNWNGISDVLHTRFFEFWAIYSIYIQRTLSV